MSDKPFVSAMDSVILALKEKCSIQHTPFVRLEALQTLTQIAADLANAELASELTLFMTEQYISLINDRDTPDKAFFLGVNALISGAYAEEGMEYGVSL